MGDTVSTTLCERERTIFTEREEGTYWKEKNEPFERERTTF
jgi:hypothetical protein